MDEEEWKRWAPDKTISTFLHHTIQGWHNAIKMHLENSCNLDKFVWPSAKSMATNAKPPHLVPEHHLMDELLEFAQAFLQYTPVTGWYTIDSANASYRDKQVTNSIINTFWKCHIQYPAWLATKDTRAACTLFENILIQASDTDFLFIYGMTEMDEDNQYAEPVDQQGTDEDQDGYFDSINKHVVAGELLDLRSKQQKMVKNIIDLVSEQGGITCSNKERRLPEKVHKKFKAFLMVH